MIILLIIIINKINKHTYALFFGVYRPNGLNCSMQICHRLPDDVIRLADDIIVHFPANSKYILLFSQAGNVLIIDDHVTN